MPTFSKSWSNVCLWGSLGRSWRVKLESFEGSVEVKITEMMTFKKEQYAAGGPFDKWLKSVKTCRSRTKCCPGPGYGNVIVRDFATLPFTSSVINKNFMGPSGSELKCDQGIWQSIDLVSFAPCPKNGTLFFGSNLIHKIFWFLLFAACCDCRSPFQKE